MADHLVQQCARCRERKSIDDFPSGENVCKKCRTNNGLALSRAKTRQGRNNALKAFVGSLSSAKETPRTDDLIAGMMRRFGGWENFIRDWHDYIERLRLDEQKCKSKLLGDHYMAIARLVKEGTAQHQTGLQLEAWSNEQLLTAMMALMQDQQPEAVIELFEGTGFKVVRGDEESTNECA